MYTCITPMRLKLWREYEYRDGKPLPPNWFKQSDSPTVSRRDGEKRLHYGGGIGGEHNPPFRFVGYADEIENVRIRHTGWYGDDEGSGYSLHRGVVVQLPARGGNTQYFAGVEWGESGSKRAFHSGGGYIDFGRTHESKEDAAYASDSMAERDAENEKEYRREESARIEDDEAAQAIFDREVSLMNS